MPMLFLDQHHFSGKMFFTSDVLNDRCSKSFSADHSMFHSTYEVRMPVHCAKEQHSRNQGEGLNANTYVPIGMGDMNYCNH